MGFKFPASYRSFPGRFGAAYCGLHEIFGVLDKNAENHFKYTDVVEQTTGLRKNRFVLYNSESLLVFCYEYNGRFLWIDMSEHDGTIAPVYTTTPDDPEVKVIAIDFLEFLQKIYKLDAEPQFWSCKLGLASANKDCWVLTQPTRLGLGWRLRIGGRWRDEHG